MIALVAALLLPIAYYLLLWQPAQRAVAKLHSTLPTLQAKAIKLADQAIEVDALRHRPQLAVLDTTALKSSIEDAAVRSHLRTSITSLEAQEPNGVRITCDAISFATWLAWLRELQQDLHIRAESVSVSALPQTGTVKISATLVNGVTQ